MALINCSECGAEISDKAAACVKCGAPISTSTVPTPAPQTAQRSPKQRRRGSVLATIGKILLITFIVGAVIGAINDATKSSDKPVPQATESPSVTSAVPAVEAPTPYGEHEGKVCGKDDLVCRGEAGVVGASVYCKDQIERQAKYSVKWTDGTFEMKMSRYRFTDESHETITYVGDKAEFQNGFGAYTPVTYQCTMDNDNKTVENVTVTEGRLPG